MKISEGENTAISLDELEEAIEHGLRRSHWDPTSLTSCNLQSQA